MKWQRKMFEYQAYFSRVGIHQLTEGFICLVAKRALKIHEFHDGHQGASSISKNGIALVNWYVIDWIVTLLTGGRILLVNRDGPFGWLGLFFNLYLLGSGTSRSNDETKK